MANVLFVHNCFDPEIKEIQKSISEKCTFCAQKYKVFFPEKYFLKTHVGAQVIYESYLFDGNLTSAQVCS